MSYVYRAYCSVPSSKHDDSNTLIMSDATPASEYVISVRGPNTKPYAYELNIDLHREQITGCKRLAGWERVYYRICVPFCKATAGTDMWFMWSLQWCRSPAYQFVDQLDCLTVPAVSMSTGVNMCVLESWLYLFSCRWQYVWLQLRHVATLGQGWGQLPPKSMLCPPPNVPLALFSTH